MNALKKKKKCRTMYQEDIYDDIFILECHCQNHSRSWNEIYL